jgi:hypothetical protein
LRPSARRNFHARPKIKSRLRRLIVADVLPRRAEVDVAGRIKPAVAELNRLLGADLLIEVNKMIAGTGTPLPRSIILAAPRK